VSVQDVIAQARDAMTVKRVFGEPYEKDGIVLVPAAAVRGGAGGGSDPEGKGGGSGFGLMARPVGAFLIRDGDVRWQPALDLNRVILGGQMVAIVALLVVRTLLKGRAKRKRAG
jgi:uncharacterized spore protein YtfJ